MTESTEDSPSIESEEEASIDTQLAILRFIHMALAAGSLIFGVVAFFMARNVSGGGALFPGWMGLFLLVPAATFAFLFGYVGRKKLLATPGPPEKDGEVYTTSKLIHWAPVESASFLSLMLYVLTSNLIYVALAALLLLGLFFLRASREEFEDFRAKRPRE